jgi:hypothetical protein
MRVSAEARHGVRVGAITAIVVLGTVVGIGLVTSTGDEPAVTMVPNLEPPGGPLPGGERTSLPAAIATFEVPIYRPGTETASDASVKETWIRTESSPQVWIEYESGLVVYVRPIDGLQTTAEFATAQAADGVDAEVIDVDGVDVWVHSNESGGVTVRLVLGGTVVVALNTRGHLSTTDARSIAASIVARADEARAESASQT